MTNTSSPPKVIFLDIDGVLNSLPYCEHHKHETENLFDQISEVCLNRLADIVAQTGAHIILSSTWKELWLTDEPTCIQLRNQLTARLANVGLTIHEHTPDVHPRPQAIKKYLDDHPTITNFVIFDDDFGPEAYHELMLSDNLIHTTFFCYNENEGGIRDIHVDQALQILNDTTYFKFKKEHTLCKEYTSKQQQT